MSNKSVCRVERCEYREDGESLETLIRRDFQMFAEWFMLTEAARGTVDQSRDEEARNEGGA